MRAPDLSGAVGVGMLSRYGCVTRNIEYPSEWTYSLPWLRIAPNSAEGGKPPRGIGGFGFFRKVCDVPAKFEQVVVAATQFSSFNKSKL